MLAASGFTLLPASTVERQNALASLPPHKFIHQVRNGRVIFVYADPTICDCLYIGDQPPMTGIVPTSWRRTLPTNKR